MAQVQDWSVRLTLVSIVAFRFSFGFDRLTHRLIDESRDSGDGTESHVERFGARLGGTDRLKM